MFVDKLALAAPRGAEKVQTFQFVKTNTEGSLRCGMEMSRSTER